ncbi:MAG: Amidohydrolase [Actinobacteria bacterium ADurb.Bin346]|nr:MAG: Amidohydrolase [Actinobacteria bacterium ADurb.Bin346]
MFIDIHAHAYRREQAPFMGMQQGLFYTPEKLLSIYDRYNIEKGILLPVVSPEIYLPQCMEDILDICQQYPDRFVPFCNIDPRAMTNSSDAPLDQLLRYYKGKGCKGLGEVMPNMPLMHPKVQNLFRHAEAVGMPVIFDGSDQLDGDFGLYDDPGLPQLEHTLQKYPDLIIFGHGPIFWSEIGKLDTPGERGYIYRYDGEQLGRMPEGPVKEEGVVPKLLRRYPNLNGDLSDFTPLNALSRDDKYGPKFLEEFQDRLFFGTDLITTSDEVGMADLLLDWLKTKKISEKVFNKIARENAIKLFDL